MMFSPVATGGLAGFGSGLLEAFEAASCTGVAAIPSSGAASGWYSSAPAQQAFQCAPSPAGAAAMVPCEALCAGDAPAPRSPVPVPGRPVAPALPGLSLPAALPGLPGQGQVPLAGTTPVAASSPAHFIANCSTSSSNTSSAGLMVQLPGATPTPARALPAATAPQALCRTGSTRALASPSQAAAAEGPSRKRGRSQAPPSGEGTAPPEAAPAELPANYDVPHAPFLTPPHLRKGRGGRQPAGDPRLDPKVDPKKAQRILANRLSAAKSKLKQKNVAQAARQRMEMLRLQRDQLAGEVGAMAAAAAIAEARQAGLRRQLAELQAELLLGGGADGAGAAPPASGFAPFLAG